MAAAYPPVMPLLNEGPTWPMVKVQVLTTIDGQAHGSSFLNDANDPARAGEGLKHVLANSEARHPTGPNPGPGRGLRS